MTVAQNNLYHALQGNCKDPDCEIHNPEVIEEEAERLTACAMFLAGSQVGFDAAAFRVASMLDDIPR